MVKTYTFDEVWDSEFEPKVRAIRQRENDYRTESMLDAVLTLCGEPVRQMTPRDMLQLDALENVFVIGSADNTVHFLDVAGLVWEVHAANDHTASLANLWRRSRVLRRLSARPLGPMVADVLAYLDRMFLEPARPRARDAADAAGDTTLRDDPQKSHFLAPLLVEVASQIGHLDPLTGQLLAFTPIPRLIQYRDCSREKTGEGKVYTEEHSLRNRCIERLNQLNAEARAAASVAT